MLYFLEEVASYESWDFGIKLIPSERPGSPAGKWSTALEILPISSTLKFASWTEHLKFKSDVAGDVMACVFLADSFVVCVSGLCCS